MRRLALIVLLAAPGCDRALFINDPLDGSTDGSKSTGGSTNDLNSPVAASCTAAAHPSEMPAGMFDGAATAASDGLVYVIGGASAFESPNTTAAYTYDPATATWAQIADLPTNFHVVPTAASVGDKVYAIGDQVFAYDLATKAWSTVSGGVSFGGPNAAVGSDGKIYVVDNGNGGASPTTGSSIYDPATDKWTSLAAAPFTDTGLASAFLDGKLYISGTQTAAYDITAGTWANLPAPSTPRSYASGGVVGGKLVLAGGYANDQTGGLDTAEAFDPTAGTWSTLPTMPESGAQSQAAVGCDGHLYIAGGDLGGTVSKLVQVYDPVAASWQLSP